MRRIRTVRGDLAHFYNSAKGYSVGGIFPVKVLNPTNKFSMSSTLRFSTLDSTTRLKYKLDAFRTCALVGHRT